MVMVSLCISDGQCSRQFLERLDALNIFCLVCSMMLREIWKEHHNSKYGGKHRSFQNIFRRTKVWIQDFGLLIMDVNCKSSRDVIILQALNFPLPLVCMQQPKIVYWCRLTN